MNFFNYGEIIEFDSNDDVKCSFIREQLCRYYQGPINNLYLQRIFRYEFYSYSIFEEDNNKNPYLLGSALLNNSIDGLSINILLIAGYDLEIEQKLLNNIIKNRKNKKIYCNVMANNLNLYSLCSDNNFEQIDSIFQEKKPISKLMTLKI